MVRCPKRSDQEWLQLIQECRTSGLGDKLWCETHNISASTFYSAISRLRKKACEIPVAPDLKVPSVDFTSKQEVVKIDICKEVHPGANVPSIPLESSASMHLHNSHTIEILVDGFTLKVQNQADPFLVGQLLQMIRSNIC